jgi:hypothetical protein
MISGIGTAGGGTEPPFVGQRKIAGVDISVVFPFRGLLRRLGQSFNAEQRMAGEGMVGRKGLLVQRLTAFVDRIDRGPFSCPMGRRRHGHHLYLLKKADG